jgi:hypothetical protein
VLLLDATRLVNQALEHPANRVSVEGYGPEFTEALEQATLALGIVHGHAVHTFVVSDLQDGADPSCHQFEDL